MSRKLLLGVGNDIRGDDGVGSLVAREFKHPDWEVVDCGSMPENEIIRVDEDEFDVVVMVDAANMGLEPGEIRFVPRTKLGVFTMSTHALPLSLAMDFLQEKAERVVLIGIQPKYMGLKEGLTPELMKAKERIMSMLHSGEWESVPVLEEHSTD